MPTGTYDLLITAVETNSHHGVGILLQRFFPDSSDFVCVRSSSLYNGEEPFGSEHHELSTRFLSLAETEEHLRRILALYPVRRILCVPYYREDFIHAILAQKITGAPLCTFLMDDRNIFVPEVPDHWVGDLLAASDLRLGISPELCAAYQHKYRQEILLLPPALGKSPPLIPCYWRPEPGEPLRAAMIGNVWTARRFEQLRGLLRASGLHVDWYGNGPKAKWLAGTPEEWEADNLRCMGFFPEEDLIAALASYPFILVPSGSLDAEDDNPAFSRLSLPSRLLFLHGSTDTPVLILGSEETAAGRFVTRLGTGLCAPYDAGALQQQIQRLVDPATRLTLRTNIRQWSKSLVLSEAGDWIWHALESGRPKVAAFHAAFPALAVENIPWLETLEPARPRLSRRLPEPNEPFRDEHGASFRFLSTRLLPVLNAQALSLPPASELELTLLQCATARYIVCGALPNGGDILYLGVEVPPLIQSLPASFKVWRITDLAEWQKAGYAGDPRHLSAVATPEAYPEAFPQFDAIVSTGWCGQLGPDPHPLEGLSLYLEACTRANGVNLHLFPAVWHPTYFWTGPAHAYLSERFIGESARDILDDLLSTGDAFVMNQVVYDLHWKPSTGKSYADFGRPLSLGLYWRKR